MQGDPDITHNARRQRASPPHPFRQSLHIAGVAKVGGGERDAEEWERDGGGHASYMLLPLRNSLLICISGNISILLLQLINAMVR